MRTLLLAVAAIAVAMAASLTAPIERLELWAMDSQQRRAFDGARFDDVVVVAIDDDSMADVRGRLGDWPYTRDVYARIHDYLSAAEARTVVYDIVFSDPRPGDAEFADALARGVPAVIAAVTTPDRLGDRTHFPSEPLTAAWRRGDGVPARSWADVQLPLPELADRAALGVVTTEPSPDGVVRHIGLLHQVAGGPLLPSLALAARYPQTPGPTVSAVDRRHVRIGEDTLPVDADGHLALPFPRRLFDVGHVPFARVVEAAYGDATPSADAELRGVLRGRTVFVGSTAMLLEDAIPTPAGLQHGVMATAHAYLSIAHGQLLEPRSVWWTLGIATIAVAMVAGVRMAGVESLRVLLLAGAGSLTVAWLAALWVLAQWRQPTTVVVPVVAVLTLLVALLIERVIALAAARVRLMNERLAMERTAELKNEFIAHVSHELRTPLTAILGIGQLLADEEHLPADKRALALVIRRNGEQLLWLVNNLLDQARISASQMTIDAKPTAVADIVEQVRATLAGVPRREGVEVRASVSPSLPPFVMIDAQRLRQILLNLAANGLKFTEHGFVHLHVAWQDGWLEASVRDTGPGIKPADLDRIFESFNQGTTAGAQRGGTGLGLTISRNLARLMGGELSVASVLGEGSTFTLRTPAPIADAVTADVAEPPALELSPLAAMVEQAAPPGASLRAVVADDAEVVRRLVELSLGRLGFDVVAVDNGRKAVDAALTQRPDLVLLDMQMPEMDGVEAARRLRERGFTGCVVALTGEARGNVQDTMRAAGFDEVLTKPVDMRELSSVVTNLIHRTTPVR